MTKTEGIAKLRNTIEAHRRGEKTEVHVSVAVSAALGAGLTRDEVLKVLQVNDFPFNKLSYVLKRHLYTLSQAGRADAEEGILPESSDTSYVVAYENYVKTHPSCPEALRRAAEALRRVEERIYL